MTSSGSSTLPGQILEFFLTNQAATALTLFAMSWFGMLVLGPSLIRCLKRLPGMKWSPREDTPDSHLAKSGTPSMGGLGIIGVAAAVYGAFLLGMFLLYAASSIASGSRLSSLPYLEPWIRIAPQFGLFAGCVALHAVLGFIDDWSKAKGRGGLTSRQKLAGQTILSLAFVFFAYQLVDPDYQSRSGIRQPWSFGQSAFMPDMDLLFFVEMTVILALVVIATSNAVNLTDGIDGLAAGLAVQCGAAFIFMGWNGWNYWTRESYSSYHLEVTWVWACLAGACLGFLAFNRNPAKVFMGDTGSLALGAALGAGALLTGTVALLPFIGFIYFVEMFSVIVQVAYFKLTKRKYGEGRRVFRRAPLHHHFELGGSSEWRVVFWFWMINFLTTLLGLGLWSQGLLPNFP